MAERTRKKVHACITQVDSFVVLNFGFFVFNKVIIYLFLFSSLKKKNKRIEKI